MANKNFEIKNGLTVAGTERITSAGVVTGTTATQSASDNTTKLASTAYVTTALANLSDSAPSTLNTLNELAAALGDDANYATTTTNAIAAKLPLAGGTLTGNLLIGTTDAGYPSYGDELTIGAASGNNGMTIRSGTSNYGTFYFSDATGNGAGTYAGKLQYNHANNSMVLATNSLDRLTIDSAGQVGIGTTSPSAQLDVQVSSNVWAGEFKQTNTSNGDGIHIRIGSSAAADYGLRVDTNAGNTPGLVVKGDGNVGIGTFTPNSPLVIQHSHQLTDLTGMSANSTLVVGNTGSGNNVYNALHLSGNQQSMFIAAVNHGQTADRRLGFFLGSAAGDALTDERLSIRGDGNVGIGIVPSSASSTTRLQIHHVDNTAILQLTNGGGGGTGANDGGQVRFDDNENMYVVNKEAGLLVLSTSNTDRLTIKADGNVGIGTAGYGTYYSGNRVLGLGVGTTIRGASTGTDPYTTIATNAYHDASAWKYIHADFASSYEQYNGTHTFHVAASGSAAGTVSFNEAMRIKADGNVGIGTASMAADGSSKFQVAGRLGVMENTGTQLQMSTGSTYSWFEAWDNSADRAPKRPICFNPWGGAVGIGTTAPHVGKLHVIGGGYAQLQIASNHSDNTNKTAGIVATNYANQTVSVMQMYNQNGNNGIYYGSADGAHRGIQSHYWYVNENYNSTSGHKLSGSINSTGAWVIRSSHQGDTVGNLKVTSQFGSSPNTSENCLINVSNGQQMIQIMAWAGNGARIGTRTGGWNSNAGGDLHITRQDSMQIKLGSGGPVLANGTAISSDRRLKKNINSIADGQLAKINALTPRTFEWKDPIDWKAGTQEGFIAQEVELVIPEAVREEKMVPDPDDTSRDFEGNVKLLRNDVITARLIKAVQELSAELDAAKARITTLEG